MTGKTPWNKGLVKESDARVASYANALAGRISTAIWTKEMRDAQSALAKSYGSGGYRDNAGRSIKYKVIDSFGNNVTLQSSYELACAKILDSLHIKWIRPKSLKYNGRRYFPDFYLPEYDLYLDPKNDFLAKKDAQKLACVCEQNSVKVIILTQECITEEYIQNLVL